MPSAALNRTGSLRSMYATTPSMSRHRQARVSHRVLDRDAGELELALGRAAPLVVGRLADTDDDRLAVHYSENTRTALAPRILALDSSVSPLIWRSIDAAECGHDPS